MKIYRIVLAGAIALSGYIGYSNFGKIQTEVREIVSEERVASSSRSALPERKESQSEPEDDMSDIALKIVEVISPLIAPILVRRRRKTLDEEIGDVAIAMGVSRKTIKGRLGLGDRRKKQTTTKRKRRTTD